MFQGKRGSIRSTTSIQSADSFTLEEQIRELQGYDLHKISCLITEEKTLRDLAVELKISTTVVDSAISDHRGKIYGATYQALTDWFTNQGNTTKAFATIFKAFRKIKKSSIIREVLFNNNDVMLEKF